jgi:protein involved in polysaccharide export with SLBB domain
MRCAPVVLISLAAVLEGGCRPPRPTGGAVSSAAEVTRQQEPRLGASTLGGGDLLEIRVFEEANLSGAFRISSEGTIDYPLCGRLPLAGKTASQVADEITQCLGSKYVKQPQVSVLIREYNSRKVFVFGEVNKPGTFPFEDSMSIIQAVTLAGGFTKVAAKNDTNVTRLVEGKELKIRVPVEDIGVGKEKNFLLEPGDIVFVPESFF